MNKHFDYVAEALQTKSTSFHGQKVSMQDFSNSMQAAIIALENLDKIKKALFYGKGPDYGDNQATCINLPCETLTQDEDMNRGIDVLHAIIGKATEAGELLEAVITGFFGDDGFDYINVVEEVGDGMWYDAILCNALGFSFDEAQRANINKLRKRYPEKFTEYDAQVRDLGAERKVLEDQDKNVEWENSFGPDYEDHSEDETKIADDKDHGFTGGFHDNILDALNAAKGEQGSTFAQAAEVPFVTREEKVFINESLVDYKVKD